MSTAPVIDKQFLRIHEQAKWLGVHPKTIGRLAAKDTTFPAEFHLSEGVRVRSLAELEAWVRSKREAAAKPVPIKRGRGRPRKNPATEPH